MPEVTAYPPGTPSWVDLGTPDIPGAAAFYGGLFGWDTPEGSPETGGYVNCTYKGRSVAGLGPQTGPGLPYWTTYVSVASADEAAAKVAGAGGTTVVEPMDVMTLGRMAMFLDPVGAPFSVWQAADHIGAAVVNEPNTLCWNEMATRDPDTAVRFYGEVFGWEAVDDPQSAHGYRMWVLRGRRVGGLLTMDENFPAGIPPHWMPFFAVDDADAAITRTQELGGKAQTEAMDIPPGRFAVLADPQGAHFSVVALVQADPPP